MKKLFIMRHAQKDMSNDTIHDFDYPLTEFGITQANDMGKKLLELKIIPDLIVASPALRTKTTAEIVSKHINYSKTIMYNEVIYQAFLNELLESISYTYDSVDSLLLVGHNPSTATLVNSLVGFKDKFEMGMVVEIDFDCNSWIDIEKDNAKFIRVIKPINE